MIPQCRLSTLLRNDAGGYILSTRRIDIAEVKKTANRNSLIQRREAEGTVKSFLSGPNSIRDEDASMGSSLLILSGLSCRVFIPSEQHRRHARER